MEEIIQKLRSRFVQRCIAERAQILHLWGQWLAAQDPSARAEVVRLVHGLAGAGGTLGFAMLSERAAAAETLLTGSDVSPEQVRSIALLLAELDSVITTTP